MFIVNLGPNDSGSDADVPPDPERPCDADAAASDADVCPLPPSVCDAGALVYYADGTCVAGACSWVAQTVLCPYGCVDGACVVSITR
jgi:hypothetical protein